MRVLATTLLLLVCSISRGELATNVEKPASGVAASCEKEDPGSMLASGVNCSGMIMAAGGSYLQALVPVSVYSRVAPVVAKIATKVVVPVALVSLPLSLYSIGDTAVDAFRKDKKCFEDIDYKRNLLLLTRANAERVSSVTSASTRQVQPLEQATINSMSVPNDYLTESFLKDLSCQRLNEILRSKKREQDRVVGLMRLDEDPRKRDDAKAQDEAAKLFANFQCYSKTKQAEILCAAGNLALFGKSLTNTLSPAAQTKLGILTLEDRANLKDPTGLRRKLIRHEAKFLQREAAVDAKELAQRTERIWQDPRLTEVEKIWASSDEYFKMRLAKMDPKDAARGRPALGDLKDAPYEVGPMYNLQNGKIYLHHPMIDDHILGKKFILAHEFEHLAQHNFGAKELTFFRNSLLKSYKDVLVSGQKPASAHSLLQMEREAIGAQWDFLQSIPKDVRTTLAKRADLDQEIHPRMKAVLRDAVSSASMPRDRYIDKLAAIHGYTGDQDVIQGIHKWVTEIPIQLAIGSTIYYLAGETIANTLNSAVNRVWTPSPEVASGRPPK